MTRNIAIRLGVEGGPELKRTLEDAGSTGQAAFQKVGAAADQASAATDKLTDKARQAAQAAAAVRPPASVPAAPAPTPAPVVAPPSVTPSPAALREAERVRYRLDADARNSVQLEKDTAAIARAEASGTYTAAYATHLRDLAQRKYGTGNDNKAGLDPNLRQGLTYQGFDVFTTLYGGMSPALVAAQQGPQIFQTLATGDGVKNNLASLGRSALGLVTPFTVATTAVAGLGIAFTVAASQAGAGRAELEKSVQGIGRATGATVGQLELLAQKTAETGKVTTGTAREIAAALAANGSFSLPAIDSVSRSTADFARLTGTDIPTATATLAAAFADPAKGADTLAKSIGGLDDKTRQLIRTQAEAGNIAGAQATLAQSLDTTLKENTRTLTGLAAGWENATTMAAKYWDRFKTRAGQVTGSAPETAEQALARLNTEISNVNQRRSIFGQDPLGLGSSLVRERDAAQIIADTERRAAQAKAAEEQANRTSSTAGELARSLDPMGQQLRALEVQSAKFRASLEDPLSRSKLGDELPKVEEAFARVTRQIAEMKRDMEAFGTTAVAALNRNADFALKTVGYTPSGRASAEAQRAYEEGLTNARTEAEREGLRSVRDKELERIRREASTSEGQRGGAFSRAPADIQRQILEATARFGTVDPGILAGVLERESGFTWTGPTKERNADGTPKTTAWGRGQITDGAAADIRNLSGMEGFDKRNVDTQVMGAAAYLSLRQKWAGGDLTKALDGYGTGRGYGIDIMRRAGQLGDVSSLTLAREQDARSRALEQEREALRLTTEAGGRDREGTLARIEAMRRVADEQGRGIVVSAEYARQIGQEAQERQRILSDSRFQQYAQDAAFQRDQLGRTEGEARGAYVARSMGYDLDSPRGQAVMETERMNDALRTTKSVAGEAFTGLLTDLRRGTDLAASLSNITGRIADRFISGAMDSVVSGLFAGEGKAGGGWITSAMAAAKSAVGFASGGYTGPGGKYDIAGFAHRGEVYFSQDDVARHGGVAAVEEMRRGGGTVPSREAFTMPRDMSRGMGVAAPQVVFSPNIVTPPGFEARTREVPDGRGNRRPEVYFEEVTARGVGSPAGQRAMASTYGLRSRPATR